MLQFKPHVVTCLACKLRGEVMRPSLPTQRDRASNFRHANQRMYNYATNYGIHIKNSVFLAYYTVSSGNCLPTFWDNLSVPYSRAKKKNILKTNCSYPNKHKFNLTEKYVPRCLASLLVGLGVDSKLLAYCSHWIAQQVSACCAVSNSLLLADCVRLVTNCSGLLNTHVTN